MSAAAGIDVGIEITGVARTDAIASTVMGASMPVPSSAAGRIAQPVRDR